MQRSRGIRQHRAFVGRPVPDEVVAPPPRRQVVGRRPAQGIPGCARHPAGRTRTGREARHGSPPKTPPPRRGRASRHSRHRPAYLRQKNPPHGRAQAIRRHQQVGAQAGAVGQPHRHPSASCSSSRPASPPRGGCAPPGKPRSTARCSRDQDVVYCGIGSQARSPPSRAKQVPSAHRHAHAPVDARAAAFNTSSIAGSTPKPGAPPISRPACAR